jgi:hypothetical protein
MVSTCTFSCLGYGLALQHYHMYSGVFFMYLNPWKVAPSPQFGLLVTGTGKQLPLGCSSNSNLVTGTVFTPSSGLQLHLGFSAKCLTSRAGVGC